MLRYVYQTKYREGNRKLLIDLTNYQQVYWSEKYLLRCLWFYFDFLSANWNSHCYCQQNQCKLFEMSHSIAFKSTDKNEILLVFYNIQFHTSPDFELLSNIPSPLDTLETKTNTVKILQLYSRLGTHTQ